MALALAVALALRLGTSAGTPRISGSLLGEPPLGTRPAGDAALAGDAILATPRELMPRMGLRQAEPAEPISEPGLGDSDTLRSKPDALAEMQEFEAFVDRTILDIRREDTERMRKDLERRRAALDESMQRMQRWLELSDAQAERFRNSIWTSLDLEAEYLRRWELGAAPESLGALKAHDRGLHLRELGSFLSQEQLELYSRKGMQWAP